MRTNILQVAEDLVSRHSVAGFILPANTGTTATEFMDHFGQEFQYVAVGNPQSSHEQGFVYHSGMSEETKQDLECRGFIVVLQEASAFQPLNSSPVFKAQASQLLGSFKQAYQGVALDIEEVAVPWLIDAVLRAVFDEQVKTCVELALVAGGCESVHTEYRYLSICTPSRWSDGFADCAVVLHPSTPDAFFQVPPKILEIAHSAMPSDS